MTSRLEIEARVAQVFGEVLEVPTVLPDDDFFELGGDSYFAVQVALELERTFEIEIPLEALEGTSTVRDLAVLIDTRLRDTQEPPVDQSGQHGPTP